VKTASAVTLAQPTLGVVVVTLNEGRRIARCLESAFRAAEPLPDTRVVVVDSGSIDDTVRIAQRYPATVCRYRGPVRSPAAGRRIGSQQVDSQYVMFLDGDCTLHSEWLREALRLLKACPDVAVVYGGREDVIENSSEASSGSSSAKRASGLGGNALYRRDALQTVGGFNPFISGNEEAELLGRIRAAGYRAVAMASIMVTHYHTARKDTPIESLRRWRQGYAHGVGQVLRLGLEQGLFRYHLRNWKQFPLVLGFLIAGAAAVAVAGFFRNPTFALAWLVVALVAFALLAARRASLREASRIVADWVVVAISLLPGFLRRPKRPSSFAPEIEILNAGADRQKASISA